MQTRFSRREFLKLGSLTLGAAAFSPYFPLPQEETFETNRFGRVANQQISLYSLPRDDARIIKQFFRDDLIRIYKAITPPTGPAWNPLWYRVWGGYVHSANIQIVEINHQPVQDNIPESGNLAEITVPYTQTYRYNRFDGWTRLYRLYYETTHWVTDIAEGPDGEPWYELTDELGNTKFFVPAVHARLFQNEELSPISPEVPPEAKRIDVDISRQTLTAYEDEQVVLHTRISSGIFTNQSTNGIPTATPRGTFNISVKMPSKHMGEGRLTDNLEDYELVGVPWTAFFDPRGYAIHGTFWHNNFGVQMSRGCINMKTSEARWLFRWMTPIHGPTEIDKRGFGTQLKIT
jgi:lipoprotein-anchoring transpeptidase ErfK/SrfK